MLSVNECFRNFTRIILGNRYNCANYLKLRISKVCFVTWQLSLVYIPLRNLLALTVAAGDDIYPEAP